MGLKNDNLSPFDDIRNLVADIPGLENQKLAQVKDKLGAALGGLKPLGRLDGVIAWLANWQGQETPEINKPLVAVFVGSHDVAKAVIGADPVALAKERLESISTGKAAVRGIASAQGAAFKVFEMGVSEPASDMRTGPSLSERDCVAAIAFGMEVATEGADIIVLGNAGLGSATAAAAIVRNLYGGDTRYWAGGGHEGAQKRIDAVEAATAFHKDNVQDPLEILRRFGGRDIAGMVGAILAARHQKIPVLLDGFVVCAAAAVLHRLNPDALDHCLATHMTTEPAHGALLDRIGKTALLDLGIGVGDGTGAALTLGMISAAAAGYSEL